MDERGELTWAPLEDSDRNQWYSCRSQFASGVFPEPEDPFLPQNDASYFVEVFLCSRSDRSAAAYDSLFPEYCHHCNNKTHI